MLSEEAIEKLDAIHSTYVGETKQVLIEEARKRNPFRCGDIIEGHFQTGVIKKVVINTYVGDRGYSINYVYNRLTKKLTPYRGGEDCVIYGVNVKRKIL